MLEPAPARMDEANDVGGAADAVRLNLGAGDFTIPGLLNLDRKDIGHVYLYAIFSGLITLSLPLGVQAIIGMIAGGAISNALYIFNCHCNFRHHPDGHSKGNATQCHGKYSTPRLCPL
ncbi:MAG: hypothetical protein HC821_05640 [Lewinella sp.]|nr:hypothetical protein [Lewinella sp.]